MAIHRLRVRYNCGHSVAVTMKAPDDEPQWRTDQVTKLLKALARHQLCKECQALPQISDPPPKPINLDVPSAPSGYQNAVVNGVNVMTCSDCGALATARGNSWPAESQVLHAYSCSFKYDSTQYEARAVQGKRGWWYTECKLCGGTSGVYTGGKPIPYAVYHLGNCRLHVPLNRVWRPGPFPGLRIIKESFTGNPSGVVQCEDCQATRYIRFGEGFKLGELRHKPDCAVGNKLLSQVEKLLQI